MPTAPEDTGSGRSGSHHACEFCEPGGVELGGGVYGLADIAPASSHHVLLLPRRHVTASVLAPEPVVAALRRYAELVVGRLARSGLDAVSFEHGSTDQCRGGKCGSTEHAHVHVLAINGCSSFDEPLRRFADAYGGSEVELEGPVDGGLRSQLVADGAYHVITHYPVGRASRSHLLKVSKQHQRQVLRQFVVSSDLVPRGLDRSEWELAALYGSPELLADRHRSEKLLHDIARELCSDLGVVGSSGRP